MAVEVVSEAPNANSFTPLLEHQSQTPNTFFGGQPVLYFHSSGARIIVSRSQFDENSILHELQSPADIDSSNGGPQDEILISEIDIWVSSR
jgi:nucleotide-sensitive chloride channel 1A